MADTIFLTSYYQNKAILLLGLLVLTALSLMQTSDATEFEVGGTKLWAPNATNYNQWAEKNRFHIGDSIVFEFPAGKDSVLVVDKEDYDSCNVDSPIHKYTNCHTVHHFTAAGSHYFISGNKDNCLHKNQKLLVIVMADRSNTYSNQTNAASPSQAPSANQTNAASPPPSGSTGMAPSQAPSTNQTNGASPLPSGPTGTPPYQSPPSGEGSPSPAAGSAETHPTPAPSSEVPPPHKNAASANLLSFFGFIGAFTASSLVFVF